MIEITNTEVMGWQHAIRGMRNPLNSWKMSDSADGIIGEKDKDLIILRDWIEPNKGEV